MGWRESINNRLRESFNLFYELNTAQHAQAHITAFHAFGDLFGFDSNNREEMLKFANSPEGLRAMQLFRKFSDQVETVEDPKTWGAEIAKKVYDHMTSVGANNG